RQSIWVSPGSVLRKERLVAQLRKVASFLSSLCLVTLAGVGTAQEPSTSQARNASSAGIVLPSQSIGLEPGREAGRGEGREGEERRENPFEDAIETDRDSFTPATTTAGRGRLIVESAYSFLDNRGVPETHSFPELLCRYGLTERLELRLGW